MWYSVITSPSVVNVFNFFLSIKRYNRASTWWDLTDVFEVKHLTQKTSQEWNVVLRVANRDRKYVSQKLKVMESKDIVEEIWKSGKLWRKKTEKSLTNLKHRKTCVLRRHQLVWFWSPKRNEYCFIFPGGCMYYIYLSWRLKENCCQWNLIWWHCFRVCN